jgi:uncharacterized membrane protein YphA (DoxX/SURF4 family)
MNSRKGKISKDRLWDYFIITARFLLAWTFIGYGYSKLSEGQFGIDEVEMATPLKDLSLFKLSWYLFDHEPFKTFIGISQIICGILLLFNRSALIGALLFLPIATTILIIDLSFLPSGLAFSFTWRLCFYLLLDCLILWHYRDRMKVIWAALWDNMTTRFKYPIWAYLILPLFAIGLEMIIAIPKILTGLILNPSVTKEALSRIPEIIIEIINSIGG